MNFLRDNCKSSVITAVLPFYEKNGFRILIPSALQEALYTFPPKNDEERQTLKNNPRQLQTRLM
jgi:hypothetical protein